MRSITKTVTAVAGSLPSIFQARNAALVILNRALGKGATPDDATCQTTRTMNAASGMSNSPAGNDVRPKCEPRQDCFRNSEDQTPIADLNELALQRACCDRQSFSLD